MDGTATRSFQFFDQAGAVGAQCRVDAVVAALARTSGLSAVGPLKHSVSTNTPTPRRRQKPTAGFSPRRRSREFPGPTRTKAAPGCR
jgi:hypothetical protein